MSESIIEISYTELMNIYIYIGFPMVYGLIQFIFNDLRFLSPGLGIENTQPVEYKSNNKPWDILLITC